MEQPRRRSSRRLINTNGFVFFLGIEMLHNIFSASEITVPCIGRCRYPAAEFYFTGGTMIAGKRHLQIGPFPRTPHADPVVSQFIDQPRATLFCIRAGLGFNVVRQHALAHVRCDHNIDPRCG